MQEPLMQNCLSEEQVAAFMEGSCCPEETARIGKHIESCVRCQELIKRCQDDVAWVDQAFELAREGLPYDQTEQISPGDGGADKEATAAATSGEGEYARGDSSSVSRDDDGRNLVERLVSKGVLERSSDPRYLARLGHYSIRKFLGSGGAGIVLQADEEHLNRSVALKILHPSLLNDKQAVARFHQEARAVGSVQHENVVTVYAAEESQGTHYLAMEYVAGSSLSAIIRKKIPLPEDFIDSVLRQLLAGLQHAHQAGLIHRDIKASNILIDDQTCKVKIVDFGLAKILDSQTKLTLDDCILGTPEYMSPEQVRGDKEIDHRTDVFSAGAVLYEMLTGRTPFNAPSRHAVMQNILNDYPPDPEELASQASPLLSTVAMRMLAKDPQDRFASAEAVLEAMNAGELLARPKKTKKNGEGRRRRVAAAIAGVCLVLFVAISALLSWLSPPRVIHSVRSDPSSPRSLLACYADAPTSPAILHEFASEDGEVYCTGLVDTGSGNKIALAGLTRIGQESSLFAFDASGRRLWQLRLSEHLRWPDYDYSPTWQCRAIAVGDFQPGGGEEIAVAANDSDTFPSRISIVDPLAGFILRTFWHTGHIEELRVIKDFFGEGEHALLARGRNDKLDGFNNEEPRLAWDEVSVVMILDPRSLAGLGPPRTDRIEDLDPAQIFAYAFLNLSSTPNGSSYPDERTRIEVPKDNQLAFIHTIEPCPCPTDSSESCFKVSIRNGSETNPGGAIFFVDRDLEMHSFVGPGAGERYRLTKTDWDKLWCPIIVRGEYRE